MVQFAVNHVFLQPQSTIQGSNPSDEAKDLYYKGNQKNKPVCAIPFGNAKVNSDGSVNLCTHDYNGLYSIGNVVDHTFVELWNNKLARKLRQALIDGEVDDFVAMGHDCAKCNNPMIGYGMADYYKDSKIRLKRLKSVLRQSNPVNDSGAKYTNLLSEIERFPLVN